MRRFRRTLALAAVVALVALPTSLPALAQGGASPARIQQRQSVLVQVDPTGLYGETIVVTQLLVTGSGQVEVALADQATEGLRNLEGFDSPRVSGSDVSWSIPATRDGVLRRTVADVDPASLPIAMTIEYVLDGQTVTPTQLLGKSGFLTVTYTLQNLTAEEREVRYFDGQGRPRTATVEVAVPMGGTFSTTLDSRFVEIASADATAIAGDGSGNTVVNGGFTLFAPAGASTQSFSWSAYVSDAIVPEAVIQIVPVNSRNSPDVGAGEDQLTQLITGFKDITNGGLILNSNLLRLSGGARQLADGLTGSAAPGAKALADGLAGSAAPGAKQLASALGGQIAPGARQLAGGLVSATSGGAALAGALDGPLKTGTGSLRLLTAGIAQNFGPDPDATQPFPDANGAEKLAFAAGALTSVRTTLLAGYLFGPGGVDSDTLILTLLPDFDVDFDDDGTVDGTFDICITATTLMQDGPALLCVQGTKTVFAPLPFDFTDPPINGRPVYGVLASVAGNLDGLATDLGDWPGGTTGYPDNCATAIATAQTKGTGVSGLEAIAAAACIALQVDGGVAQAASGAITLKDGLAGAASGASALADGIDKAAAGAKSLSDGLGAAATGATQLADGLGSAAEGAETIAGGTVALSEALEGNLVGGTTEGAAGLSLQLEQLRAADARGIANEGLLFGVADGAEVTGVYKFVVAGVGGDETPDTATLALVALVSLALAGVVGYALRRRVVA